MRCAGSGGRVLRCGSFGAERGGIEVRQPARPVGDPADRLASLRRCDHAQTGSHERQTSVTRVEALSKSRANAFLKGLIAVTSDLSSYRVPLVTAPLTILFRC